MTQPPDLPAEQWAQIMHPSNENQISGSQNSDSTKDAPGEDSADRLSHEAETSDDVPSTLETTFSAIAASISNSIAGMSRWSVSDLTLGLYKLSVRHVMERDADTISGSQIYSIEELREILHWFNWAFAAYEEDKHGVAVALQVPGEHIVKHYSISEVLKPAFYIAIDDIKHCIVLSIRGTLSTRDILTDLNPHSEQFESGYAHSGMLAAARWLMDNELHELQKLLATNAGYGLVIVGHSLGAGTAALLSMLLREVPDAGTSGSITRLGIPASQITCWGYGCPPCVDKRIAEQASFIHNVVLQDDVISRLSPAALEDLRTEILKTDWSHVLTDGSKSKRMIELAQSTYSALRNVEPALGFQTGFLYSQAQKFGQAALLAAKDGITSTYSKAQQGEHGSKAKQAVNLLTIALRVGSLKIASAGDDTSVDGTVVTEQNKNSKDILEVKRLFVPGILYHVIRKPINVGAADSKHDIIESSNNLESEKESMDRRLQCIVVRGNDPSSRFRRIILSRTLFSDHSCIRYKESIVNALHVHDAVKI